MMTYAIRVRRPEATSVTGRMRTYATRATKPESTAVMPPGTAAWAAESAANLVWVITATRLTGKRPIDRSYRKRGTTACAAQVGRYRKVVGNDLYMGGLGTCCAFGKSLARGFRR